MQNDKGIELTDINWVQAGANAPGREEKVELNLPEGINLERIKDKSLSQLLACGEIDCAIIARPPTCFLENHPDIIRLFPDYVKMEEAYFEETGVWPIMHILAMKRSIHDSILESPVTFTTCSSSRKTKVSQGYLIRRYRGTHHHGLRPMPETCGTS